MIKTKQYNPKTQIRDCSESLWRWIEMRREDAFKQGKIWAKYPTIGDLGFDVWEARQMGKRAYGTTAQGAIQNL